MDPLLRIIHTTFHSFPTHQLPSLLRTVNSMAKLISSGLINGKVVSSKYQSTSSISDSDGRRSCPPIIQETESKTPYKLQLREPQSSIRETSMTLKNIFSRAKTDNTDNRSLSSISENVQTSPRNRGSSGGGISGFAKTMALKSSFISKDSNDTTYLNLPFSGPSVKRTAPAHKISRSSIVTSSSKPISQKQTKHFESPPQTWEAPSLYQMYPQAIKYSCLSASTLSADAIIRVESNRRSNSVRESLAKFDSILRQRQSYSNSDNHDENSELTTPHSHHRRKSSKNIASAEWTQKIFALVTSGYLLQYAGSGRYDRMPEKILQLGKDSVAFASDAIPGKHWVLQVSQSMGSDGISTANSRSLLSRLNFRGMDSRKIAKSLLLVFDSADDLESWIYVIRREIKILGGRLSDSGTTRYYQKDKPLPLPKKPCQRFILHDTEGSSSTSPNLPLREYKSSEDDLKLRSKPEMEGRTLFRHHSVATIRSSIGNYSTTNSIFSLDARRLEGLNGSHNRSSYMSSGQRTMITSQSSSVSSSPILSAYDDHCTMSQTDEVYFNKPTSEFTSENRKGSLSHVDKLPESISSTFQSSQDSEHRCSLPRLINGPPPRPPPKCALPPIPPRSTTKKSREQPEFNVRAISGSDM
ncbi:putative peptidase family m20 m25 m40 protein [Erysiphe neolycopersici]|uniref:Putative peptidase family m20 m25 m40 protein n=1 Tax=Erysiphe neolycopersici TaxID=212602 RepID=A0A420HZD6_9PEZI|nr:putative peptidase family m20 m25 m40 protein [Erysiphe neolycopersici]